MIFFLLAENCLYQEDPLKCLKQTDQESFKSFYREAIPQHLKKTRNKALAEGVLKECKFLYGEDYPFIFSLIKEFQELTWFEPYAFDEKAVFFYDNSLSLILWKAIFKPLELSNNWILKAKKNLLNLYIEYPHLADHPFHEKFYQLLDESEKKEFLVIFYLQNHTNKFLINQFFQLAKKENLNLIFSGFMKNNLVPGSIFSTPNPRNHVLVNKYRFSPEIYLEFCSTSPLKYCPGFKGN